MHPIETIISLLALVIALSLFAKKLKIVFPVLLTLAGLVISLIPGLPEVVVDPSVVLLVFLPPILYGAAWYTNVKEFFKNIEPIVVLALGLVLATCLAIAYTAYWLIPGFTIATGFLLGAIVSPPDAVAATAVLKKVKVPKKIVSVLEGESLVNDASALVVLQLSLATVITGEFSLGASIGKFFILAIGGIVIGLVVGYTAYLLHKYFSIEPAIETVLTFVTAYGAFILAEKIHVSGVLSVVSAGLFMGAKQSTLHSAKMRMQAVAVWDFVIVLLNGLIFILIGLQLPHIVKNIPSIPFTHLLGYGILMSVVTIGIRFVYIFMVDAISNRIRRALGKPTVFPTKKHTAVLSFTAMRGIVSIAAAFSIPVMMADATVFPNRDIILFLTFCVILSTLVLQGLSLPWFIRRLAFKDISADYPSLLQVRKTLAQQALTATEQRITTEKHTHPVAQHIIKRLAHQVKSHDHPDKEGTVEGKTIATNLLLHAIEVQRKILVQMRNADEIDIEHFHKIEQELDVEEARLLKKDNDE